MRAHPDTATVGVPPSGGSDAGGRLKAELQTSGGNYKVVVVPKCKYIPLETMSKLLALAESGATVIFADYLPNDVSGWSDLEKRRGEFKKLAARINGAPSTGSASSEKNQAHAEPVLGAPIETKLGKGRVLVGNVEAALTEAGIAREAMFDHPGLMCIRRAFDGGRFYVIANRAVSLLQCEQAARAGGGCAAGILGGSNPCAANSRHGHGRHHRPRG